MGNEDEYQEAEIVGGNDDDESSSQPSNVFEQITVPKVDGLPQIRDFKTRELSEIREKWAAYKSDLDTVNKITTHDLNGVENGDTGLIKQYNRELESCNYMPSVQSMSMIVTQIIKKYDDNLQAHFAFKTSTGILINRMFSVIQEQNIERRELQKNNDDVKFLCGRLSVKVESGENEIKRLKVNSKVQQLNVIKPLLDFMRHQYDTSDKNNNGKEIKLKDDEIPNDDISKIVSKVIYDLMKYQDMRQDIKLNNKVEINNKIHDTASTSVTSPPLQPTPQTEQTPQNTQVQPQQQPSSPPNTASPLHRLQPLTQHTPRQPEQEFIPEAQSEPVIEPKIETGTVIESELEVRPPQAINNVIDNPASILSVDNNQSTIDNNPISALKEDVTPPLNPTSPSLEQKYILYNIELPKSIYDYMKQDYKGKFPKKIMVRLYEHCYINQLGLKSFATEVKLPWSSLYTYKMKFDAMLGR